MTYVAFYEDAAKVEAAAKARGFTGQDGESWHDFVEAETNAFLTSKSFSDLEAATAWLKAEISETKSVYGCGYIRARARVERRCSACVCRGVHDIREYVVDDEGVADEETLASPCLDDQ